MIEIHWNYIAFTLIMVFLLYKTIKVREVTGPFGSISEGLENLIWLAITLVFLTLWGGIFWW